MSKVSAYEPGAIAYMANGHARTHAQRTCAHVPFNTASALVSIVHEYLCFVPRHSFVGILHSLVAYSC